MIKYLFDRLETMLIDPVWFIMTFAGVLLAIGSWRHGSVTRWRIIETFCTGMVCGISAPVIVRDVLNFESTALLAISAMLGSFFGMKITATVLKLDIQQIVDKRFKDEGK